QTLMHCGQIDAASSYYRRHRLVQQQLARTANLPSETRYLQSMWARHVGHLAHLDVYVKIGLLGWRASSNTVLLAPPEEVSNHCLLNYWRPYIEIISDAEQIEALRGRAKCQEDYVTINSQHHDETGTFMAVTAAAVQNQWEAEGRSPLLQLSDYDTERGRG